MLQILLQNMCPCITTKVPINCRCSTQLLVIGSGAQLSPEKNLGIWAYRKPSDADDACRNLSDTSIACPIWLEFFFAPCGRMVPNNRMGERCCAQYYHMGCIAGATGNANYALAA